MATLYMGTTKIKPARTASEITEVLQKVGARTIQSEFDEDNRLVALKFQIPHGKQQWWYRLPIRTDAVLSLMGGGEHRRPQAERTAWRMVLRWVQAQAAMIEAGQVEAGEAFIPHLLTPDGETTLYRVLQDKGLRALPGGTT